MTIDRLQVDLVAGLGPEMNTGAAWVVEEADADCLYVALKTTWGQLPLSAPRDPLSVRTARREAKLEASGRGQE